MTVLKGEGKVPILYRTASISVGTANPTVYVSRPDLTGEFPTVMVVPDAWGITGSVKDICRRIARWGFAAVALDPYRGSAPNRSVDREAARAAYAAVPERRLQGSIDHVVEFLTNRAGFWSNAEDGLGILGLADGGPAAVRAARRLGEISGLALVASPLRPLAPEDAGAPPPLPAPLQLLPSAPFPVLGLFGKADDHVPVDDVMELRSAVPQAELVLYPETGHDFMDDYLPGYDHAAASDAIERIVGFFEKHLPDATAATDE